MREIKFQYIWRRGDKIALCNYDLDEIQNGLAKAPRSRDGSRMTDWECVARRQYTGLTDKNGVEIYEGDILSGDSKVFGSIVGDVKLSEYPDCEEYVHICHFGWNLNGTPIVDLVDIGLEVIGNVHQHPELIK